MGSSMATTGSISPSLIAASLFRILQRTQVSSSGKEYSCITQVPLSPFLCCGGFFVLKTKYLLKPKPLIGSLLLRPSQHPIPATLLILDRLLFFLLRGVKT
ncbi:hypothetical protein CFOL_v3_21968 [Cephalotus follicularis]|uniref:Uncharacterized protein n=1 Tax=Cephalotus follicularis TaxID=3775 RepID=A0A1Q3CEJ8_CEPFO|nr:hypothetical protein CFOL_v3_21968 [Cephalotus follicularis]